MERDWNLSLGTLLQVKAVIDARLRATGTVRIPVRIIENYRTSLPRRSHRNLRPEEPRLSRNRRYTAIANLLPKNSCCGGDQPNIRCGRSIAEHDPVITGMQAARSGLAVSCQNCTVWLRWYATNLESTTNPGFSWIFTHYYSTVFDYTVSVSMHEAMALRHNTGAALEKRCDSSCMLASYNTCRRSTD